MNRADAVELDEQKHKSECKKCLGKDIGSLESELFHAKQELKNLRESTYVLDGRNSKIRILLEVITTTYETNETDVQKKASEKLLALIQEF